MDNCVHLFWLSLACTPGSKTFAKLLTKFTSPREVYDCDEHDLKSLIDSKDADYSKLLDKNLDSHVPQTSSRIIFPL